MQSEPYCPRIIMGTPLRRQCNERSVPTHPSEGNATRGVSPHTPPKAMQREGVSPHTPPKAMQREECPHTPLRRQCNERSVPTHPSEGNATRGVSPHTPPKAMQREECPHTPLRKQSSERSVPTSERRAVKSAPQWCGAPAVHRRVAGDSSRRTGRTCMSTRGGLFLLFPPCVTRHHPPNFG